MTTYQDIVDYMNKNYWVDFKLFYNNPGCIIKDDNDYFFISINKDSYSTIGTFDITKGLNKLLADLLDTPVNQRNKRISSEIIYTIKPMTKESVYTASLITSADQVIQAINTFLVNARCNSNPNPIMTIATDIGEDNLNKVLKLYDDYNIEITNQIPNSNVFNLFIEPN